MLNPHISNPYADEESCQKVTSMIGAKPFNYFFRHIFAGETGSRQAMIGQFFEKFHAACVAEGIEAFWHPDNQAKVADVLSRLSFPKPRKRKS